MRFDGQRSRGHAALVYEAENGCCSCRKCRRMRVVGLTATDPYCAFSLRLRRACRSQRQRLPFAAPHCVG